MKAYQAEVKAKLEAVLEARTALVEAVSVLSSFSCDEKKRRRLKQAFVLVNEVITQLSGEGW